MRIYTCKFSVFSILPVRAKRKRYNAIYTRIRGIAIDFCGEKEGRESFSKLISFLRKNIGEK